MSVQLLCEAFVGLMLLALAHGTALVLLTWAASATLLRRCRPSVHAALWTVVLVKFLLPPVLPGDFGLSPMLSSLLPTAADSPVAQPLTNHPTAQDDRGLIEDTRPGITRERQTQADLRRQLPAALLVAYSTLVSLFGVRALMRARRVRRRIRRLPAADARLAEEVTAAAAKLGLARPPRVLTDAAAASPFVVGAWRPALVMPASLPARIDGGAREALIIHELAHIRRGDTLVRWLRNAARLLFFFWPPVWWLCRRVERFSEMACDEWAVRLSPVTPRAYAEALLDVAKAARRGGATACQQIALASRDEGLMAARFEMILGGDCGGRPRPRALATAALTAWGLFALAGGTSASPAGGATETAAEVFDEAAVAGHAPRGRSLVSNPTTTDAAQETERVAPAAAPPRRLAPTPRPRVPDHGFAARASSEKVTDFQPSQGRDEPPTDRRPATQTDRQSATDTGRQPATRTVEPREFDLDGDGTVSDFEAGYSAGLRYRNRTAGRYGSAPGLANPSGAHRGIDADSLRRREMELRATTRRARPADETP